MKSDAVWAKMYTPQQDLDLDELETPQYLTHLPDSETNGNFKSEGAVSQIIDDIWVSKPGLIEQSLEELEAEDTLYRQKLSETSFQDKAKSKQLLLQRKLYAQLIELTLKLHKLEDFKQALDATERLQKLLKKLTSLQKLYNSGEGRITSNPEKILNSEKAVWDNLATVTRDWSSRINLKIGADVVDQVEKEAETKKDWNLFVFLTRELKTEDGVQKKVSIKKPKHKQSKNRRLNYEVHDKLQNFMTPLTAHLDLRTETLINTLFGKKEEKKITENVLLDIPLL